MALMPDSMRFTSEEQAKLDKIKADARVQHEKNRKTAARAGRKDFPMFPYECSAAYEHEFLREVRKGQMSRAEEARRPFRPEFRN